RAGGAVRLLHVRHHAARRGAPRRHTRSHGRRGPARARSASVPLRVAQPHRSRRDARGDRDARGGAMNDRHDPAPAKLPGSLDKNRRLAQWLRFAEGFVEVRSGKVEIGQGILTTLAQIVADELEVPLERVRMVRAHTAESPNEGVTSGSLSTQDSGTALRYACAEARALLMEEAARRLGTPAASLSVAGGEIRAPDGKRTSYWEIGDAALRGREATASVAPKAPAARRLIGRPAQRIDL